MSDSERAKDEANPPGFSATVQGSIVAASVVGPDGQAHGTINVHHHHGLSFTEAERLFGLLFDQNFPRLAEAARVEARRRVDEFATTFTRVAAEQKVTAEQLEGLAEPDVQFTLNEAIQAAARKDNPELRSVLAQLISRRLQSAGDEPKEQLLGEAVSVVGKLTSSKLRSMALCFLLRDATLSLDLHAWRSFNKMLEK